MLVRKSLSIACSAAFLIITTFTHQPSYASNSIEQHIHKRFLVSGESVKATSLIERMAEDNVPGLSIAVLKDGKIVWAKGFGIANSKTKQVVDKNTLFQAGSISKPIGALAALKLVEEGKLSLDEDVNKYLKGFQITGPKLTKATPVTLRQLLTHTAGLSVHGFPGYVSNSNVPSTLDVLTGKGNTDKVEVVLTPGTEWRYSGGGYTVMQLLVEQVSGQTFAEYTDVNILKPMGMSNSTYQHALPQRLKTNTSAAFDQQGKMHLSVYNDYPEKPAAGLWTTPTDILKYAAHMQAIMQGKKDGILQKSTVEDMFTKHQNSWGLGPELMDVDGQLAFGHGGKNLGFTNEFIALVNQGDAFVVMANGDNAGGLNSEIITTLSKVYDVGFSKQKIIQATTLTAKQLKSYEGDYLLLTDIGYNGDFISKIRIEDGKVTIKNPGDSNASRLVPESRSDFISTESGNSFVFKIEDDKVTGLTVAGRFELKKL